MTSIRTFIALDLENEQVRAKIVETQKELLALRIEAKPVEPENLHFTIKFLGEIDESKLESVNQSLSDLRFEPIKVLYKGLGAFPSLSRINVIWVGVDEHSSKAMISLWKEVESRLAKVGFPAGNRFDPHLTIMRVKSGLNKNELSAALRQRQNEVFGYDVMSKLKIKKSLLTPSGPIYTDLVVIGE
ncbi:MAG: RNA 2',3'-cyclic phosphodiesterase [Nitrososphaeria archaeon]